MLSILLDILPLFKLFQLRLGLGLGFISTKHILAVSLEFTTTHLTRCLLETETNKMTQWQRPLII